MKSIQALVDESLKAENSKERKRSGKFSPSLFGRCVRAQVWNRANEPKTDEPQERLLRVFMVGKLFHDFVQKVITKENPDIRTEVVVSEDDIVGYADIVNGDTVIDLKTVHSGAFHWMTKEEDISESKKPNILQVMYYTRMLNKKAATLCFISKDDLCLQEYTFILNERWNKELDDELSALRKAWKEYEKDKTLPKDEPRAYKDKKTGKFKECQFCSWKTACNKNEKGE